MTHRIHIVGSSPRTGTTLMYELMVNGFHIDGFDADHEVSVFRRPSREYRVYLSKNPGDVRFVRPLLWADRKLWIVHMVRDPRDVVVSRHGRAPHRYYTNLRIWRSRRQAARRVEGHPRFITVRYEDLVQSPERVQDSLISRMPFLVPRGRFGDFHTTARPHADSVIALHGVRPVDTASIGAWRRHKARLAAQIALHGSIDADLRELGYESGPDWHTAMDGVLPDNGDSHLPDQAPRHRLHRRLKTAYATTKYIVTMLFEQRSAFGESTVEPLRRD